MHIAHVYTIDLIIFRAEVGRPERRGGGVGRRVRAGREEQRRGGPRGREVPLQGALRSD